MAKKKLGIYSNLESTANNKVEDLYLIVDNNNIVFSVKNKKTNAFVAFEHFANNADNNGWHPLIAYLQNNSKLIHGVFGNVYFVSNSPNFILTNKLSKEDTLVYFDELNLVHGKANDEELYLTPFDDQFIIAFAVPDAISTLLYRSFPTGKWHHYAEYVLAKPADNELLIYLFENNYLLRIVNDGKTQLINYYSLEGDDQNCYTILNACKSTDFEPNDAAIKVWGYSSIQHAFITKLATYFKKGEVVESPNEGIDSSINASDPQNIYSTYFIF